MPSGINYQRILVFLRYQLDLSNSELRGGTALLVLVVAFSAFRIYRSLYFAPALPLITEEIQLATAPVPRELLALFSPDTVSITTLKSWGIPENVAENWVRYRAKAGTFSRLSQISGLYGMTDSLFMHIRDSIILREPVKKEIKKATFVRRSRVCPSPMDANLADTLMLARLHGIGAVLSRRITLYREKLGGYIHVDQVRDVYGISDSTFLHIRDKLYVDESFVPRKLDLDSVSYKDLYDHPYISSRQATAILRYREHHPDSVDLSEILALDQSFISRISPYVMK